VRTRLAGCPYRSIDGQMLAMADISTWMTDAGGFDVLPGLVAADGHVVPYEELVQRENLIRGHGFTIRASALEDIMAAKEHADRPKDREALPLLRALWDARTAETPASPIEGPRPRRGHSPAAD
jgi:hypothetical protein